MAAGVKLSGKLFIFCVFLNVFSACFALDTFDKIKEVICKPQNPDYNIHPLLGTKSWTFNGTTDTKLCLNQTKCDLIFTFCRGYNCSDTDASLMNTTACLMTPGAGQPGFKLGSYDPQVNQFSNSSNGGNKEFFANFTKGGEYKFPDNRTCSLSMDMIFACKQGSVWQADTEKKQSPVPSGSLKSFKFDEGSCKFLVNFDYNGACPTDNPTPAPPKPSVSFGTVLVIMFLIIVPIYFIFGSICKYSNGARGAEVLPNHEFWTELPGYIADGCKFTANCCRPRHMTTTTSRYDSI